MENLQLLGQQILEAQPFSRFLGARLAHFSVGEAVLVLSVQPDHLQQHGFVHGGLISYLVDNALTFAGGSHFGDALTVEFKVNYMKPGKAERLRAVAKATAAGKRVATCQCEVWAERREQSPYLCAIGQGTVMAREKSGEAQGAR